MMINCTQKKKEFFFFRIKNWLRNLIAKVYSWMNSYATFRASASCTIHAARRTTAMSLNRELRGGWRSAHHPSLRRRWRRNNDAYKLSTHLTALEITQNRFSTDVSFNNVCRCADPRILRFRYRSAAACNSGAAFGRISLASIDRGRERIRSGIGRDEFRYGAWGNLRHFRHCWILRSLVSFLHFSSFIYNFFHTKNKIKSISF